jgi:hypothetical protein
MPWFMHWIMLVGHIHVLLSFLLFFHDLMLFRDLLLTLQCAGNKRPIPVNLTDDIRILVGAFYVLRFYVFLASLNR